MSGHTAPCGLTAQTLDCVGAYGYAIGQGIMGPRSVRARRLSCRAIIGIVHRNKASAFNSCFVVVPGL